MSYLITMPWARTRLLKRDGRSPLPTDSPGSETVDAIAASIAKRKSLSHDNQTVIIDHMDQTGSKTYESTPNMMYIIDSNGTVVYAADWMLRDLYAPQEVEKVLSELEGDRRAPIAPETSSTFGRLRASVEGGWNAFWQ